MTLTDAVGATSDANTFKTGGLEPGDGWIRGDFPNPLHIGYGHQNVAGDDSGNWISVGGQYYYNDNDAQNKKVLKSNDYGATWSKGNLNGNSVTMADVAYGGGKFMVVASYSQGDTGGYNFGWQTSDNGATWTQPGVLNNAGQNEWGYSGVAYGLGAGDDGLGAGGKFVAISGYPQWAINNGSSRWTKYSTAPFSQQTFNQIIGLKIPLLTFLKMVNLLLLLLVMLLERPTRVYD